MPRRSATYGAPCSSAVLRILPSVARGGVEKHKYLYHIPPVRVKEHRDIYTLLRAYSAARIEKRGVRSHALFSGANRDA